MTFFPTTTLLLISYTSAMSKPQSHPRPHSHKRRHATRIPRPPSFYLDDLLPEVQPVPGLLLPPRMRAHACAQTVTPVLPAITPALVYPTVRAFALHLQLRIAPPPQSHGSASMPLPTSTSSPAPTPCGSPWLVLRDELDTSPQALLHATGVGPRHACVFSLSDTVVGELLRLTACRTGRDASSSDMRVVTCNAFGDPVMTTYVPPRGARLPYVPEDPLAGAGPGSGGGVEDGDGHEDADATEDENSLAGVGLNELGGMGDSGGGEAEGEPMDIGQAYATSFRARKVVGTVPTFSPAGMERARVAALVLPGDRGSEVCARTKATPPVMRVVRSDDGMREWVQTAQGEELASLAYSAPGPRQGTPPFMATRNVCRVVAHAGVDLSVIAAVLASRIWIFVETGAGG